MASTTGYQPRVRVNVGRADPAAGPDRAIADGIAELGGAADGLVEMERKREFDREVTGSMSRWAALQEKYGIIENEAKVSPKSPGAAGHAEAMRQLSDKLTGEFMKGVTEPQLVHQYERRIAEWQAERAVEADSFERLATARLGAEQVEIATQAMENLVRGKSAQEFARMMVDVGTMALPSSLSADAEAKTRRNMGQRISVQWIEGNEPEQRLALLNSGRFDAVLSGAQMEQLRNGADSDVRRKIVEAEAAARAQKAQAVEQVDDVLDRIDRGYPVTDAEYTSAMKVAEGAGLDKRVRDLNDAFVGKRVNQEYAAATPAQMDARIKVIDAELAKAGDKGSPALVAERAALDKLLAERKWQVASDPLAAGAAMGIRVEPVDWSDPNSVAARRKAADATARAMGVPAKYLSDEEAAQLAANATNPAGQLAVGRQLRALGPRAAIAAARQVLPNDDLFAYSMGLSAAVQQNIARGKELRREFPVLATDAQPIWREATGSALGSLPTASREGAYLAAVELYRQAASARGKDEFDPVLFRGAIREALGGNASTRSGGVGEWNGAKIILPPTMSQAEFDARLGGYVPQRAYRGDKTRIPATELRDRFTPQLQPNGSYRFVSARGEYVVVEDGRTPLELDISRLKPTTGAAARPQRVPESQRRPVYVAPPAPNVQGPRSAYEAM
jgi:hypothetical protein